MPDPRSLYYKLARFTLQVTAGVLTCVLVACVIALLLTGDTSIVHYIISSAQALSCIALGVMSYHLRPERQVQQDDS